MSSAFHIARRIALNDFRQMTRDGRFRLAAIFTLSPPALSFFVGWREYRQDAARRAQSARTVREQWINQGDRHPHRGTHRKLRQKTTT
jgi:ABC-2 type transport system permease protein